MAEHAHTTPTSAPSPSGHRPLIAGYSAVIIGFGITVGVTASIANPLLANPRGLL